MLAVISKVYASRHGALDVTSIALVWQVRRLGIGRSPAF
jgi:hypothetical protein